MRNLTKLTLPAFFALCLTLSAAWTPMTVVPESAEGTEAAFLGSFIALDGRSRPEAATRVRVWRDAEALHVHFACQEPYVGKMLAKAELRDSDQVWADDCVELFLQPQGDTKYYHFITNRDGKQFDECEMDKSWDGEWSVKAAHGIYDWSAEVIVPFSTVGAYPEEGAEWRMNVGRSRHAVDEVSSWCPTIKETFHDVECFGTIRFSSTEPYPVAELAGMENAPAPAFSWHLDKGEDTPEVRTAAQRPGLPGYQLLSEEFLSGDKVVMRCYHIVRNYRAPEILAPALARLEENASEEAKMYRDEATLLLDGTAIPMALYLPLEREATALAERIFLYANTLEYQAQGHRHEEILYGVESPLIKILPIEPYGGTIGAPVLLDAGRNEMAAAQVTLFAGDSPALLANAHFAGDFAQEDGTLLGVEHFRIRREGFVRMIKPSYKIDYTGPRPDPLMEVTPFDIPAFGRETLWVDVRVPTDAKPGRYKGKLVLTARNALDTVVPVEVLVRNFTIPKDSSIVTAFGLHGFAIKQNEVSYRENMHEHRVSPYVSCRRATLKRKPFLEVREGDALIVTVSADRAGILRVVASDSENRQQVMLEQPVKAGEGQRFVATFHKADFDGLWSLEAQLKGVGLAALTIVLQQGERVRTLIDNEEAFVSFGETWLEGWPEWEFEATELYDHAAEVDWAQFDEDFEMALARGITSHELPSNYPRRLWLQLYYDHLREKDWLKYTYTYLADEPEAKDYPYINSTLANAKRIGAHDIRNMMTARSFPEELRFVDIWCPEIYSYDEEGARAEQERGINVWWYTAFGTRHPYPNFWIDYPAIDCRVWPWMSWKHDLDGMLYWAVTWWGWKNPWFDGETFPTANGDGSLMYPGEGDDGTPVDSLRWECFRDGMEDYEVFCLLEAARRELGERSPELSKRIDALLAIDPNVVQDFKSYNFDPKPMLEAREAMSDALEEAIAVLGHQPEIVGRPRWRPGIAPEEAVRRLAEFDAAEVERKRALATKNLAKLDELQASSPAPKPEAGLRVYYDFEDKLTVIPDLSGNRLDGLVHDGEFAGGRVGKGLRILEQWSWLLLPGGTELLGAQPESGTVAFWVKPSFGEAFVAEKKNVVLAYLMETDVNGTPSGFDEIGIYLNDGKLKARIGGKPLGQNILVGEMPSPLKPGVWTHLALTWKPGERILYVDGKEAFRSDAPFSAPKLDGLAATLGSHPTNLSLNAPGVYDEYRLYDRALTSEEIQNLAK